MDDDELTRLAEEELMREANRGEARAAVHGVMGYLQDKKPRTNKRFLTNTISNALQHNHRQRSVGTVREDVRTHQSKEKLKHKEQTDSHADKKRKDKKLKKKSKHTKSKHNQDSDSDDFCDKKRSKHHKSKHRKSKHKHKKDHK